MCAGIPRGPTMIEPTDIVSARIKPARLKPAERASSAAAPPTSKSAIVAKLLARRNGATVADVSLATGWQPHSVRAFFSGLRKKGGTLVRDELKDGSTAYRLIASDAVPVTAPAVVALADVVRADA